VSVIDTSTTTRGVQGALGVVTGGALISAFIWGRASRRMHRSWRRIAAEVATDGMGVDAAELAHSAFRKQIHTTILYLFVAGAAATLATAHPKMWTLVLLGTLVPVGVTFRYGRRFLAEAQVAELRSGLERRAEQVLSQQELAPMRWAARLAPADLPAMEGFDIGRAYAPGTGAMAGDFYDVYATGGSRAAAVIGDVSGHGIEPSITAFQVKYLLRVFLRQYRDPAQALEELNTIMSAQARPEEFVSLAAVVFDTSAGTLRYASAGHPPAWLWSDGELRALRATGPLLTLDPHADYTSRELTLELGDLVLLYTDGLTDARAGNAIFGDERVATLVRRDAKSDATRLCRSLLEAAQDFASGPLKDDVAILAVRRV